MDDQRLKSLEAAKSALEAPSDESLRVPYYCEENIWRLAYRKIHGQHNEVSKNRYHVVFVSNPKACVPMFQQLAANDPETPVMWDYHVVLLMTTTMSEDQVASKTYVIDIDSYVPYPCPLKDYVEMVFPNYQEWMREYLPYFR